MLLSTELTFSDAQVTSGASEVSDNVIDLGATGTVHGSPVALVRDIGKGNPIPIIVRLDADAGGTSPTLVVTVEIDTVENFASEDTVATSILHTAGVAGDEIWLNVYLPEGTNQRYLRLLYTTGGTTPVYTLTAAVVAAKQSNTTVPGA